MSIEAINWVLNYAPIPSDRRDASSLTMVLVGLANHADPDGRNAFPAVSTLVRYSRLSESTVRRSLDALHDLDLIAPSDPTIIAAYIKRADRRPQGWDLAIHLGYPQEQDGVSPRHPAVAHGVSTRPNGVSPRPERGVTVTPEPSLIHPRNHPARERAPEARSPLPPPCGQCDARPGDPVSARVVWLDERRERSAHCPRCHPAAAPLRDAAPAGNAR